MIKDNGYRVMVVEDEPLILNHLVAKIEELPLPLTVSATAANGEDALKLIRQNPPDILFTDIRMPIIDGLQLAKAVSELYPSMPVVIISGYDEFNYAQQAIRYHVTDYLIKPVNYEKLLSVTSDLCDHLLRQRRQTFEEILNAALSGTVSQTESDTIGNFYVTLIKIGNIYAGQTEALVYDAMGAYWEEASPRGWLKAYFAKDDDWWLIDIREFSYHLLITRNEYPSLSQKFFSYLGSLSSEFCVNLCQYPEVVTARELRKVLRFLTGDIVYRLVPCHSQQWVFCPNIPRVVPILSPDVLEEIMLLLKRGHIDVLEKYLCALLEQWQAKKITQSFLTKYMMDLTKFLSKHNACSVAGREEAASAMLPLMARSRTDKQLYTQLSGLIRKWVFAALSESHGSVDLYQQIKQYLEKSYQLPITIESLANTFHFSPSYISRIFKKYEKQPPIQYLIQIRMTRAGELMKTHPEIDIKIVAELVGYSNQHYFSRYFKQYFAMAPSDYKKSLEKNGPN
ncbi:MAG: response regulator [Eubacteriales bacterium]|nr:response regulator [Eubacteriales bacterium]